MFLRRLLEFIEEVKMRVQLHDDAQLVLKTAKQLASGLIKNIAAAQGLNQTQLNQLRHNESTIHFHDDSTKDLCLKCILCGPDVQRTDR